MTSQKWLDVPVQVFAIRDLVVTQPGVLFKHLLNDAVPYGGDKYPHVVVWEGIPYLEDGHHRLIREAVAGHHTLMARGLVIT